MIFASNFPIKLVEPDAAFEDRCLVIPFKYRVPKSNQDHKLLEKLENERVAIVKKSLLAYKRLCNNDYKFSGEDSVTVGGYLPILNNANIVETFVEARCDYTDFKKGTFTTILYDEFLKFCRLQNLPSIGNIVSFSETLKNVCGEKIMASKWRDKDYSGGSLNGYKGIVLK